ncbi:hypothetical protein ACO0LF_19445 [Undibacterium sp. Di27W]|uniref:hypothetical protein n=1 Tax=Undibacterium sp. Di27W TaxID=3413036 RepID=UPI003BEF9C45
MKLKHVNSSADFIVEPKDFLNCFDAYDREETLGEELNQFDPNEQGQLEELFERYFFCGGILALTPAHKIELVRVLKDALHNKDFDFSGIFQPDHDAAETIYLPSAWRIDDPRAFFENIYGIVVERWKEDLISANISISS